MTLPNLFSGSNLRKCVGQTVAIHGIFVLFSLQISAAEPPRISDVIPLENAMSDLWRGPDGKIYGSAGKASSPFWLVSPDEGETWQRCKPYPFGKSYKKLFKIDGNVWFMLGSRKDENKAENKYEYTFTACRWEGDPRKVSPTIHTIDVLTGKGTYLGMKKVHQVITLPSGGKRVLFTGHAKVPNKNGGRTSLYYSDDGARTWIRVDIGNVPDHEADPPHKRVRWQNPGVEATVVETAPGTLRMLMRTSLDYHYECFSSDCGATWSDPAPSPFYGTLTMPRFHKISDSAIMLIWNNCTPTPEQDAKDLVWKNKRIGRKKIEKMKDVQRGAVAGFNNREALHAALSKDGGETWRGFREILNNPIRNAEDFATSHGGTAESNDKSVHQSQAITLKDGRVLIHAGQHPGCRRFVTVDPNWLLENGRNDDFTKHGLDDWHVQLFLKEIDGHCAYNRRIGAKLVADPCDAGRKVLRLVTIPDPALLLSPRQGALWNFPAARDGIFRTSIFLADGHNGAFIGLNDRWLAPMDPQVGKLAPIRIIIDSLGRVNGGKTRLSSGKWHTLCIRWSYDRAEYTVSFNDEQATTYPFKRNITELPPHGLSYLHTQSAPQEDRAGFLIGPVSMTSIKEEKANK